MSDIQHVIPKNKSKHVEAKLASRSSDLSCCQERERKKEREREREREKEEHAQCKFLCKRSRESFE